MDSSLGNDEVLNIRWANDDPNPALRAATNADNEAKSVNAMLNKWGSSTMWQHMMPTEQSYPDTDPQYAEKLAQFRAESAMAREALAARNPEDIDQTYAAAPADGPYDPSQYAAYFASQHPELQHTEPAPVAPEAELAAQIEPSLKRPAAAAVPDVPTPGAGVNTKNIAALINARMKKAKADVPPPAAAAANATLSEEKK